MQFYLYEQKTNEGAHRKRIFNLSKRLREIHLGASVTSKIYNSRPTVVPFNSKRVFTEHQNIKRVEHENMMLLQRINDSGSRFRATGRPSVPRRKSLNREQRLKEKQRISTENNEFVGRIIKTKS
jgi:hypothetical protein